MNHFFHQKVPVIGELVVKPIAGRNLSVKEKFGKQDVFVEFTCGQEKRQSRVDKNGGTKPVWNDIIKFELKKGISHLAIKVICSSNVRGERRLIGEALLDLEKVLKLYTHDGWFQVKESDKYSGDVYLELTFYPEGKPYPTQPGNDTASTATNTNNLQNLSLNQESPQYPPQIKPANLTSPVAPVATSLSTVPVAAPVAAPLSTIPSTTPVNSAAPVNTADHVNTTAPVKTADTEIKSIKTEPERVEEIKKVEEKPTAELANTETTKSPSSTISDPQQMAAMNAYYAAAAASMGGGTMGGGTMGGGAMGGGAMGGVDMGTMYGDPQQMAAMNAMFATNPALAAAMYHQQSIYQQQTFQHPGFHPHYVGYPPVPQNAGYPVPYPNFVPPSSNFGPPSLKAGVPNYPPAQPPYPTAYSSTMPVSASVYFPGAQTLPTAFSPAAPASLPAPATSKSPVGSGGGDDELLPPPLPPRVGGFSLQTHYNHNP